VAEEQVLMTEARAELAEEAAERVQQAAEEAKPAGTNWLLVIGAAVVAFVVSAGLI